MRNNKRELKLQVGGTVNPRTGIYIVRPSDDELLRLLERGEYANVLCSRQMGKSSLLIRTKTLLAEQGCGVASIDVPGYLGSPNTADEWYQGLLDEIARQLGLKVNLRKWWASSLAITPNQRLIQFFRDQIAAKTTKPTVIFLDEIDGTLKLPYTDDFFVAIRAMYNDRADESLYERLTFCLVGVASPNELIKDPRTTPYNIGRTIELEDFDLGRDDLNPLVRAMSNEPEKGKSIVQCVLKWTDGHPYLTVSLCDRLRALEDISDQKVNDLVIKQFANIDQLHSDVHFKQVLSFLGERIDDRIATLSLYQQICTGSGVRDHTTPAHIGLKLTGLVKRDRAGFLKVRNPIYSRVFSPEWVSKALEPDLRGFEKLLSLLGGDRESAADEYERLRQKLIKFFVGRRSDSPEDLADETLDRVVNKLDQGLDITNLDMYCYGIANNIVRERLKRSVRSINVEEIFDRQENAEDDSHEVQLDCLDQCLEKLLPEHRDLITTYYGGDKRARLGDLKTLAAQQGMAVNALRVRAARIRKALQQCVENCVSERTADQ